MRLDPATGRHSDEIEITPSMIEEGVGALALWDKAEHAELIVRSVFRAMTFECVLSRRRRLCSVGK